METVDSKSWSGNLEGEHFFLNMSSFLSRQRPKTRQFDQNKTNFYTKLNETRFNYQYHFIINSNCLSMKFDDMQIDLIFFTVI